VPKDVLEDKILTKPKPSISENQTVRNEEADDHLEIPAFLRRQAN